MQTKLRLGIAMIELIFAIVILGIVMMSAPTLISTAAKSGYVALQQEAIATAASELGMILTHHWDEGDTNASKSSPVLVTLGNTDLNQVFSAGISTGRRAGTPVSSHRKFFSSIGGNTITTTSSVNLGPDAGDRDDIDDYDNISSALTDYESTTAKTGDTVDTDINLLKTVTYISDAPTGAGTYSGTGGDTLTLNQPFSTAPANDTSNIKYVTITLTTTATETELDKTITLNAFSCNIGTYQLNEGSL